MDQVPPSEHNTKRYLPWLTAVLVGVAAPVLGILLLLDQTPSPISATGPLLALGLMGVGIISAAAAGSLWLGVSLALLNGISLLLLAQALNILPVVYPTSTGLAMVIASLSFAARGALFATSLGGKGWLMALFVVAGEAAILLTALALPGVLPRWLLALLPAQWASLAIQSATSDAGALAALPALLALAGTASTTLLVARLWPSRWPYALMFTAWLGLSALVYYWPAPVAAVPLPTH